MSNDRARGMRADMLRSMAKVRVAYDIYLRVCDEYRIRVRAQYAYPDDGSLSAEHEKLAEQQADRDPISIAAATTIKTHLPIAQMYASGYLVEVDAAWRFDASEA